MKWIVKVAPWVIIIALAVSNTLLIKQNIDLRWYVGDLETKLDPASRNLQPGEEVEGFETLDLNGDKSVVSYANSPKKKLLLFFTPSCPYCAQQIPFWRDVLNKVDPDKVEVYGMVGERDDRQEVIKFIQDANFTTAKIPLKVILASDSVLKSYKLSSTPASVIVSNEGKVEKVFLGRWSVDAAKQAASMLQLPPQ